MQSGHLFFICVVSTPNLLSQQSSTSSDMVLGTSRTTTTTMTLHTASQSQSSQWSSDMELSTEGTFINNHSGFRRARDTSPTDNSERLRPTQRLRVSYASSLQTGLAVIRSAPGRNMEAAQSPVLRVFPSPSSLLLFLYPSPRTEVAGAGRDWGPEREGEGEGRGEAGRTRSVNWLHALIKLS